MSGKIYVKNVKDAIELFGEQAVKAIESEKETTMTKFLGKYKECGCSEADLNLIDVKQLFRTVAECCYNSGYKEGRYGTYDE